MTGGGAQPEAQLLLRWANVRDMTISYGYYSIPGCAGAAVVMMCRLCVGNSASTTEQQPELTVREASQRLGQAEHEQHKECGLPRMPVKPCPLSSSGKLAFPIY